MKLFCAPCYEPLGWTGASAGAVRARLGSAELDRPPGRSTCSLRTSADP